jgi:cytochrome bd-type quinol oxidase subunit 1
MRGDNAWIIWAGFLLGINLQKSLSIIEIFVRHADKARSVFYLLSLVAYAFNIVAILLCMIIVDYVNDPYPVSRIAFQSYYLLVSVGNNISSFALFYLLYSRVCIFYKVFLLYTAKNDTKENFRRRNYSCNSKPGNCSSLRFLGSI